MVLQIANKTFMFIIDGQEILYTKIMYCKTENSILKLSHETEILKWKPFHVATLIILYSIRLMSNSMRILCD